MRRLVRTGRWVVSGTGLLVLGGCFTNQLLIDFGRTEVARTISDFLGQLFQLAVLSTS